MSRSGEGAGQGARRYLRFVAFAAVLTGAVAGLGVLLTRWLGGEGAVPALLAGCLVSWVASVLGGIPILLAEMAGTDKGGDPALRFRAVLGSMVLRFAIELLLIVVIAWGGRLDRGPFLIWAALSYLALLAADTKYALGPRPSGPAPGL